MEGDMLSTPTTNGAYFCNTSSKESSEEALSLSPETLKWGVVRTSKSVRVDSSTATSGIVFLLKTPGLEKEPVVYFPAWSILCRHAPRRP